MSYLLIKLLNIYFYIIIARALMSWFNPSPYNPIVRFVYILTEPVLGPIRRVVPPIGGLDLSPMVVFLIILLLQRVL